MDSEHFYDTHGYYADSATIPRSQVALLRDSILRLLTGVKDADTWGWQGPLSYAKPPAEPIRMINAWWISHAVRSVVTDSGLARRAAALMGVSSVSVLHDQVIIKCPSESSMESQRKGIIGWHQDYAYWDWIDTTNLCTCLIQLQRTDAENGAITVVAGSHLWGYDQSSNTAWSTDLDGLRVKFQSGDRAWNEAVLQVDEGQPTFHHALLFHSSSPNLTSQYRITVAIHYFPTGAKFRKASRWSPLLTCMGPHLCDGDPIRSASFPIVWSQ